MQKQEEELKSAVTASLCETTWVSHYNQESLFLDFRNDGTCVWRSGSVVSEKIRYTIDVRTNTITFSKSLPDRASTDKLKYDDERQIDSLWYAFGDKVTIVFEQFGS